MDWPAQPVMVDEHGAQRSISIVASRAPLDHVLVHDVTFSSPLLGGAAGWGTSWSINRRQYAYPEAAGDVLLGSPLTDDVDEAVAALVGVYRFYLAICPGGTCWQLLAWETNYRTDHAPPMTVLRSSAPLVSSSTARASSGQHVAPPGWIDVYRVLIEKYAMDPAQPTVPVPICGYQKIGELRFPNDEAGARAALPGMRAKHEHPPGEIVRLVVTTQNLTTGEQAADVVLYESTPRNPAGPCRVDVRAQ